MNGGLFVDAEHRSVLRWIHVQTEDVSGLLFEQRIVGSHMAGLREFVSFLERKRSARITVNLALKWATKDAQHTPGEWAVRLSIVRVFARHWSATDPSPEVPPLGLLPYRPKRAQPYFYSNYETERC